MKKIVCIKCTADLGIHSHGAEAHIINYFIENLKVHFDEIHLVGNEISYLHYNNCKKFNCVPYIQRLPTLKKILHIPISIVTLFKYCQKYRPNLIISLGAVYSNGLAAYICAKWFKIKFLVRPAEDYYRTWIYTEGIIKKIYYFFFRNLLSNYIIKNCDYAIFPGKATLSYYSKKIKNKFFFYLNGPLYKNKFKKKKIRSNKKKIILFVGPISDVKGANFLPYIIEEVLKKDTTFKFIIIGENHNNYIYNKLIKLNSNKIRLIKAVTNNSVYDFFKKSDLLIFLTRVGVGIGLINLEATKIGLPVISYRGTMDVKNFFKKNNYDNIDIFIKKILSKKYNLLKLDNEWNTTSIKKKFNKIFGKICNEIN